MFSTYHYNLPFSSSVHLAMLIRTELCTANLRYTVCAFC